MKKFTTFIAEAAAKNTHMEHLEDSVLNGGVNGTREAINFLRGMRDTLAGNATKAMNTTVKWDGAPAIFAGVDPRDGQFFIAKKGIFNKNPKVYKTDAEIDADVSGDLAVKFKLALKHLPELGIKGVIQGDFLFSYDTLGSDTIDGEDVYTFHPNTIVYTVPVNTELGKTLKKAKIGVVWHTKYEGSSFEDMKAVFGQDISTKLNKSKNVWHTDATFKDVSGKATMTAAETAEVTKVLSAAGKLFRTLDAKMLNTIADSEELKMRIKTHFNTKVRAGQRIKNPTAHAKDLVNYIAGVYDKEIEKKKTAAGKASWEAKKKEAMKFFSNANLSSLVTMFEMMNLIIEAKEMIIRKMDQASSIRTLLRTANGYEVTSPEGYVAIDHKGNAVKLVNRLTFSRANFSADVIKGWQK
jgi:hypothetical protein